MTKKTGEQMLIELGFEKSKSNSRQFFRPRLSGKYRDEQIFFNEQDKCYYCLDQYDEHISISTDLHQAIHQYLIELGWLEDDTTK